MKQFFEKTHHHHTLQVVDLWSKNALQNIFFYYLMALYIPRDYKTIEETEITLV